MFCTATSSLSLYSLSTAFFRLLRHFSAAILFRSRRLAQTCKRCLTMYDECVQYSEMVLLHFFVESVIKRFQSKNLC